MTQLRACEKPKIFYTMKEQFSLFLDLNKDSTLSCLHFFNRNVEEGIAKAEEIGYPVMIKASEGNPKFCTTNCWHEVIKEKFNYFLTWLSWAE